MAQYDRAHLTSMAKALSRLPPNANPLHNPDAHAKLSPQAQAKVNAIKAGPSLHMQAVSGASSSGQADGPSATDPTGATKAKTRAGGDLGWGSGFSHLRMPGVRHVLLGVTALTLAAGVTSKMQATPLTDFKPDRFVSMPGFSGTIAGIQSGLRPQYVSQVGEDADMYQPISYGGELDLDAVKASIAIIGQVTNGNATASQTFYGAFIGEALGKKYRAITSKLQVGSLGTSGSVSASGTGSLTLYPLIEYTARKVLFTPGASFSDAFIITSISSGIQPQLMSGDPVPASVFSDLFPLFVDFDPVTANVPLIFNYQNVSAGAAVLKGSTRGDCDPEDLVKYGGLTDVAG